MQFFLYRFYNEGYILSMTENRDEKGYLDSIEASLNSIQSTEKNSIAGIFLDETLSEFYQLNTEITVPGLPVKEITLKDSKEIAAILVKLLPEFLHGSVFLEKRRPQAEQHSLHFIRPLPGVVVDFVHIIRFNFRFSGRNGTIISKGDSERYPSYTSDRIYFKSQLVPVYKGSDFAEVSSVRLKESLEVKTDQRRFTSVIFDEYSTREISIELSRKAGADIFSIPVKIYPFINYEYFTSCLSIPDPSQQRISASVALLEPLFLYFYFSFRESGTLPDITEAAKKFSGLALDGGSVILRPEFILDLKDYFSSYSLSADDDLLLKGWKKFEIS